MDSSSSFSKNTGRKSGIRPMSASVLHWKKPGKEKTVHASPSSQLALSSGTFQDMSGTMSKSKLYERFGGAETKYKQTLSAEDKGEKVLSVFPEPSKSSKNTLLEPVTYSRENTTGLQSNSIRVRRPITRLQKPMVSSVSAKASSKESLMSSSDSVQSLHFENIVRSHSFSHSNQNTLLPFKPLTRSHSFNKTINLTGLHQSKPFSYRKQNNTAPLLRNSNSTEGLYAGEIECKTSVNRPISNAPLINARTSFIPVTNCTCSSLIHRGSSHSCSRSDLPVLKRKHADQYKNLAKDSSPGEESKTVINDCCRLKENEAEWFVLSAGVTPIENEQKDIVPAVINLNGDADKISIFSLSSCDKNDQSEECDFLDMEGLERCSSAGQPKVYIDKEDGCRLNRVLDLSVVDLAANLHLDVLQSEVGNSQFSSGSDLSSAKLEFPAACSVELSPSDSSDGTYMWDEEGLEPVLDAHPCRSFDSSDMNSQDILNNLDSFDLEDDDLMLDVDLSEDAPLEKAECESMAHKERSEKCARPHHGLWRSRAQNWSVQEQNLSNSAYYCNSSSCDLSRAFSYPDSSCGHLKGYSTSDFYRPPRVSLSLSLKENTVILDELTLCHMIQECTSVKTQLLKLKRLLQKSEEDASLQDLPTSVSPTLELQEEASPALKIEELLNEIVQLKEGMKKKDEEIQHLQLQAARCKCLKGSHCRDTQKTNTDKFTQTPRKGIYPPILQPSRHILSTRDRIQEKLAKPIHTEAPSRSSLWVLHNRNSQSSPNALCVSAPALATVIPDRHSLLSRVQLKPNDFALTATAGISFSKKNTSGSVKQHDFGICSVPAPQNLIKEDIKPDSSTKLDLKRQVLHSKKLQLIKPKTPNTRAISGQIQKGPSSQNGKQSHLAANEMFQQSDQHKRTTNRKLPVLSFSKTKDTAMPKTSIQFPQDAQLNTSGNSETQVSAPCSSQQFSLRKENTRNQKQNFNLHYQKGVHALRHSYLPKPKAS